ncbi:MAG: NUMOD4 domain-containing protein, partial [Candidatus Gastranaerophilales bacterium]|nr:NUMOD4 domain-containing protein [Candidatus Gastranaerophilales bacterium]
MKQIGTPYKEYYYLCDDNRVYNSLTKRYLRKNNNMFKLVNNDNKRVNVTLKELYYKVHDKVYCIDDIENLDNEEWKEIKESNGNYFISNMGRIKSYKGYNARILSQVTTANGYKRININFGNSQRNYLVHRLVADYFLPMPQST